MIDRLADYWSSKKPKRTKLWQWLSVLLTFIMVVYLVYAFTQGGLRLNQINWKAYAGTVIAVLGICLFSLVIQFTIWSRIISFHRKVNWQDISIYAGTIMMRSLPGGAWHWVGRISMYSGATKVPTRVVVVGNFLEWALSTLSGAAIFFVTLPIPNLGYILAVLTFSIILGVAISWQPATRKWTIRVAEGILWMTLYGMLWLSATEILYLIVQAVVGPDSLTCWEALRASTLTGTLGMLISMLPSSLGVREISMVWLLQAKLTPAVTLLIALMLRIIYTLGDAVWGIIGWLLSLLILRKHQPT